MSLAVDEATDKTQLFLHSLDGDCFREDILGLIPLEGHTTGDIIFQRIVAFFKDDGINLECVNMLATDGMPSTAGKVKGLSAWLVHCPPMCCVRDFTES